MKNWTKVPTFEEVTKVIDVREVVAEEKPRRLYTDEEFEEAANMTLQELALILARHAAGVL